jgi:hypothetical protein
VQVRQNEKPPLSTSLADAEREFPGLGTRQLLEQWQRGETDCPLQLFARILIEHEVRAALDAELAAL